MVLSRKLATAKQSDGVCVDSEEVVNMLGGRTFFTVSLLTVLLGFALGVVCSADVPQEAKDTLLSIGGEELELTMDGECGGIYEQGHSTLITVTASQDGYLYLFDFDADPDTVSQFFPHPFWDTGEVLQAGVPVALPPEDAETEMLVSSESGEGLVFGVVVAKPINAASVFTNEDIGGWWEIESGSAEEVLAKGLATLIAALPAETWYATGICHYTVVAPAPTP